MDITKTYEFTTEINGVKSSVNYPFDELDAEKFFCKTVIEKICQLRDDVVAEYLEINRNNSAIIVDRATDDFYTLLCANDLIPAFLEFCSNTKGIRIEDMFAKIETESYTWLFSYLPITK